MGSSPAEDASEINHLLATQKSFVRQKYSKSDSDKRVAARYLPMPAAMPLMKNL